jgi:hypothetical protein
MRSVAVWVAAGIIILGAAVGKPLTAQPAKEDAAKGGVQRSREERPFGGPPPMQRGVHMGKTCRTPTIRCTVDPPKAIGAKCTCLDEGRRVHGKVAR